MEKFSIGNILELREAEADVMERLLAGEIEPALAKEISNAAGKILGSLKVQLAYGALSGHVPQIAFLDDGTEGKLPPAKTKRLGKAG